MRMKNDRVIAIRYDPVTGKGLLLVLGIISQILSKAVKKFEVDSYKKWTPFSMVKTAHKTVSK